MAPVDSEEASVSMAGLSIVERAKLLLLLGRRALRIAVGRLSGHPLIRWRFIPRRTERLLIAPQDLRTADGTRAISKDYLDVGKMFGARTHNMWFGIALPSAMPFIAAGIELGFARGITNAIAVEVLASVPGMGMSVFTKSNELNENASLVYVMCLGVFAVGVRAGMIRFRHWLAPWYTRN